MTGGQAFTLFLVAALLVPPALYLVIAFGEREAPTVHRWYLRHARGINWALAALFSIMAIVTIFRPAPVEPREWLWRTMGPTGYRLFFLAMFVLNAVDHAWRALRAGRQVASQT